MQVMFLRWNCGKKTERNIAESKRNALKTQEKLSLSSLVRQCSRAIRDRVEAAAEWPAINNQSDVLELLKLIRKSLYNRATTRQGTHTLLDAENALHQFRQTKKMTVSEYAEKLKALVEVHEHLGGEPGTSRARLLEQVDEPSELEIPTKLAAAKASAREEYMATLLLARSDPRRFAVLVADVHNEHTRGLDGYPDTFSRAYDMLVNYKSPFRTSRFQQQDGGLAFYQEEDDSGPGQGRTSGRAGRGRGRGRGTGHGGRGGRGCGRPRQQDAQAHVAETEDEAEGVEDNLGSEVDDYIYSTIAAECFFEQDRQRLPENWILIDSCSTTNLISNKNLLHNIHKSKFNLKVRCNAGSRSVNQRGYLGGYPEAVWYNPGGIANIMSMQNVSKYYRLTMDTSKKNGIYLHRKDGRKILFSPSQKGLYYYALGDDETFESFWSLINTVSEQAEKYTRRQYQAAQRARKMQNIIMRMSDREMTESAIRHLRGCLVTRGDIQAATDIFGPNIGSLKGKTVHKPNQHVRSGADGVPPEIMAIHQNVTLCIDIMFINNIPFFITYHATFALGQLKL